jgi:hypothetical protein
MLPDFKQLLFSALRFRQNHVLELQATFASGVATVDTANTVPGFTLGAAAGSGVYPLVFPKGLHVHVVGVVLDPSTNAPAPGVATYGFPRQTSAAGTANVVFAASDGTEVNPADGSRCYITLLLGKS